MPGTRKLGRPTAARKAMLRGMVTLLLENGKIETTVTRAKEVRSIAEKMITLGKKAGVATAEGNKAAAIAYRRQARAYITKKKVVDKVFSVYASQYADRKGGYTQIFKLGPRRGDGAEMALLRLVDYVEPVAEEPKKADKSADKKADKTAEKKAEQAEA